MARSKEDITYGTAQARLSEDETLRVRYKHGTLIEGGKIAESEPVDLFADARRIAKPSSSGPEEGGAGDNSSSQQGKGDVKTAFTATPHS